MGVEGVLAFGAGEEERGEVVVGVAVREEGAADGGGPFAQADFDGSGAILGADAVADLLILFG